MAQGERAEQPHPPKEAARSPDGRANQEDQRLHIEEPGEGRARLHPQEGLDGADDPNRRSGTRQVRRHAVEHGMLYEPTATASRLSQAACA